MLLYDDIDNDDGSNGDVDIDDDVLIVDGVEAIVETTGADDDDIGKVLLLLLMVVGLLQMILAVLLLPLPGVVVIVNVLFLRQE